MERTPQELDLPRTAPVPCPCCATRATHPLLVERAPVPTLQNTALASREEARAFPAASLAMAQCQTCSFVWNAAFSDDLIRYDESYDNDVSGSAYYRAHLEARADAILDAIPADTPIHYVEIGCGEADFMVLLMRRAGGRVVSATGFDPSFSGRVALPEGAVVHRGFFTAASHALIPQAANVICSRHTIEHIAAPRPFAATLAGILTRPDQRLFVETPIVDWIFAQTAFFDFFFEHCSLFNPASMGRMFAEYGLSGPIVPVYGGQYMWAELRRGDVPAGGDAEAVRAARTLAARYVAEADARMAHWTREVAAARASGGRVGIWGAASKGVTFALLLDQAGEAPDFAIDVNPGKQGRHMPLTGLRIDPPGAVGLTDRDTVIVMNPNYLEEIRADLAAMGTAPRLLAF